MKITPTHWDQAAQALGVFTAGAIGADICNKAIEIALAEANTQQETYITAKEARKRGAGNAEWLTSKGNWCVCGEKDFLSHSIGGEVIKYRALQPQAQPEPVDHVKLLGEIYGFLQSVCPDGIADETFRIVPAPIRAQAIAPYVEPRHSIRERVRHTPEAGCAEIAQAQPEPVARCQYCDDTGDVHGIDGEFRSACTACDANKIEPADPHAALRAEYAKQVAEGTTGFYLWEVLEGDTWQERGRIGNFYPYLQYRRTPKPTCQVQLINGFQSGEVITMTREAARKLQAELGDTVEWFDPESFAPVLKDGFNFTMNGTYTYRTKVKKHVSLDPAIREGVIALLQEFGLTK